MRSEAQVLVLVNELLFLVGQSIYELTPLVWRERFNFFDYPVECFG